MSHRPKRVASEIQKIVSAYLLTKLKEPMPAFVTISEVEVSPDLTIAKIHYSAFGEDAKVEAVAGRLENEKKAIRQTVGKALGLRLTPEIVFLYNDTPTKASHIESLLKQSLSGKP